MKLLSLILAICSVGCAKIKGNSQTGEYSATFVATDMKAFSQTADRVVATGFVQTKVPLSAIRTAGTIGVSAITNAMLETVSNNATAVSIGEQGVTTAANAGREATKQLKITTDGALETAKIPPAVGP